jgi:hypothetical protein
MREHLPCLLDIILPEPPKGHTTRRENEVRRTTRLPVRASCRRKPLIRCAISHKGRRSRTLRKKLRADAPCSKGALAARGTDGLYD